MYNGAHTPNYGTSLSMNLVEVVGFVSDGLEDKTTVTIPKTVKINGKNYTVYGAVSYTHLTLPTSDLV